MPCLRDFELYSRWVPLKAIKPKEGVVMKLKFQFDLERSDTSQRVLMNSLVIRG